MLDMSIARMEHPRVGCATKDGIGVKVEDVSFEINSGETVCIAGESGSDKSVSSLGLLRLIEYGVGTISDGRLRFDRKEGGEVDLAQMDQRGGSVDLNGFRAFCKWFPPRSCRCRCGHRLVEARLIGGSPVKR